MIRYLRLVRQDIVEAQPRLVDYEIIIVVLLVLMGLGLFVLVPIVNERVSGFGYQLPQPAWSKKTPLPQNVSTSAVVRFMRVVGGLLILVALVIGLAWRTQSAD